MRRGHHRWPINHSHNVVEKFRDPKGIEELWFYLSAKRESERARPFSLKIIRELDDKEMHMLHASCLCIMLRDTMLRQIRSRS